MWGGAVEGKSNDKACAAVVEHFDKKEEIATVSHICSKGVAVACSHTRSPLFDVQSGN